MLFSLPWCENVPGPTLRDTEATVLTERELSSRRKGAGGATAAEAAVEVRRSPLAPR